MKKLLLVLCTFTSIFSFAQINYEPGYFITNDGKKTDCFIQNRAWRSNPTQFQYYYAEGEKPQTVTIETVSEVNVSDIYKYKRFTVKIDVSSNKLDELSVQKTPIWVTKTIFLKILVEGKVNLYQYENNDNTQFFISTGNHQNAEQLVYKEYLEGTYINKNQQFKQQLHNTLLSDRFAASDFNALTYAKNPLISIIMKYNEADGKQVTDFSKKQNVSKISIKATAGIGLATLKSEELFKSLRSKGKGPSYRIGFEIEATLPFNNNKWTLFIDPNFNLFNHTTKSGNYNVETKYAYLQLPAGVRHYVFLSPTSKIFINAGFAFNFPTDSKTTHLQNVTNNKSSVRLEKSSTGFAGIGYSKNKSSAELRYNFANWLANNPNFSVQHSLLSAVISYKF